ncbi:MAG: hypothetical protein P8J87_07230, partial [Verrucomicrobiales bacterium]|nr:hypothetical protein [Verrucomicrobiales bacterium]
MKSLAMVGAMKAVCYEKFCGALEVCEVAEPEVVAGGMVVRVEAAGVCRSDWHGWRGHDDDIRVL